jgi:hypothetical protein
MTRSTSDPRAAHKAFEADFTRTRAIGDIQRALGVQVPVERLRAALEAYREHLPALQKHVDVSHLAETEAELKHEWGESFGNNTYRLQCWLRSLPEGFREELLYARDEEGRAIFNKPEVLRAIMKHLNIPDETNTPPSGSPPARHQQGNTRRLDELKAMMRDPTSAYFAAVRPSSCRKNSGHL